jgi:hypothetical protein
MGILQRRLRLKLLGLWKAATEKNVLFVGRRFSAGQTRNSAVMIAGHISTMQDTAANTKASHMIKICQLSILQHTCCMTKMQDFY